jgi:hypothetical protein
MQECYSFSRRPKNRNITRNTLPLSHSRILGQDSKERSSFGISRNILTSHIFVYDAPLARLLI